MCGSQRKCALSERATPSLGRGGVPVYLTAGHSIRGRSNQTVRYFTKLSQNTFSWRRLNGFRRFVLWPGIRIMITSRIREDGEGNKSCSDHIDLVRAVNMS